MGPLSIVECHPPLESKIAYQPSVGATRFNDSGWSKIVYQPSVGPTTYASRLSGWSAGLDSYLRDWPTSIMHRTGQYAPV